MKIPLDEIRKIAETALKEDVGSGDITTEALICPDSKSRAVIISRDEGVVAGLPAAREVFRLLDKDIEFNILVRDGEHAGRGRETAVISGSTRAILTGERTALNILGRLSGIAGAARAFSELTGKYGVRIMDTRKTSPGLRALEKYAVSAGGGCNHRMGLYDAVLIKDNHIHAAGCSVGALAREARKAAPPGVKIEVEAADAAQLRDALEGEPDIILLDNMTPGQVMEAVGIAREKAPSVLLEVSGNITLENVEEYASCGVDMISVGALTHSVKNFDFSLVMDKKL